MCKRSVINLLLDTHEHVSGLFYAKGEREIRVLGKQLSLTFKSQSSSDLKCFLGEKMFER